MQGLVLISAGFMLCCLGLLLSLPSTTSDAPSALAGAKVGHMERGADAPAAPGPDGSYLLMPAEELQETDKLPVNAYLLTMLVLALASLGTSVGWLLMTNARRRGALVCSVVDDDRGWLAVIPESLSFLGVFRL
jgi:hypothetical protein